ncbi:MAG: hypothetical protein RIB52_04030 [Erythrobacter sp.]|uniref:hypothetical protein n=1 Tax=Erythrobacter sp. TaxID=1042 RepID=UPI0032EF0B04
MRKFRLSSFLTPSRPLAPAPAGRAAARGTAGPRPSRGTAGNSARAKTAPSSPDRTERAEALRGQLDAVMGAMHDARADAEGIARLIAELESEAERVPGLAEENRDLARRLDERQREAERLEARGEELAADLARAREETGRAERRLETAMRERGEMHRAHEEARERARGLSETAARLTREADENRAAREQCEMEIARLRTTLGERDRALEEARHASDEARLAAERDAKRIAESEEHGAAQERRVGELSEKLATAQSRHERLEEEHETLRERARTLETARADLEIAFEAKAYALTGELTQERSGHEVTRRLLDEMREENRALGEENRNLKDQSVAMARETEQVKQELGSTRSAIRDHGDRLGEVNRRFAATQDECARLEKALAEARKDSRALARKVERLERVERENDELHEKMRGLQGSLDHYRRAGGEAGAGGELVAMPLAPRGGKTGGGKTGGGKAGGGKTGGGEAQPAIAAGGGKVARLPHAR